MTKAIFVILLTLVILHNVSGLFRMQKVHCESHNKSIAIINQCRLRAISREIAKFYVNATLLKPIYNIDVGFSVMKKENGFKPFLYNFTIDACKYFKKRNHPIVNLIYGLFKDFSNMNHTCPYTGHLYLDGFYLRYDLMNNLPMPNGEYLLKITWYLEKIKSYTIDVYFEFKMN